MRQLTRNSKLGFLIIGALCLSQWNQAVAQNTGESFCEFPDGTPWCLVLDDGQYEAPQKQDNKENHEEPCEMDEGVPAFMIATTIGEVADLFAVFLMNAGRLDIDDNHDYLAHAKSQLKQFGFDESELNKSYVVMGVVLDTTFGEVSFKRPVIKDSGDKISFFCDIAAYEKAEKEIAKYEQGYLKVKSGKFWIAATTQAFADFYGETRSLSSCKDYEARYLTAEGIEKSIPFSKPPDVFVSN